MFHSQSRVERAPRRGASGTGGEGVPRRGGTGIDAPPSLTPLTSIYPLLPPPLPPLRFRRPRAIPLADDPRPYRARRALALSPALSCSPRYSDARRVVGGSRRRGGSSGRHSFVRRRAARIGLSPLCSLRVARCAPRRRAASRTHEFPVGECGVARGAWRVRDRGKSAAGRNNRRESGLSRVRPGEVRGMCHVKKHAGLR